MGGGWLDKSVYPSVYPVGVLAGGVSELIWPSCCPSFFCLSLMWMYFFPVFYQTPSLLSCVCLCLSLSLSMFVLVSVCLSFLCVFSSPSLPPPPLPLSSVCCLFSLSLSLTLAVSTFGETPQEHHPVKFFLCPPPPPPPLCPPCSPPTGSNWLLALSFFVLLIVRAHSRCCRTLSSPSYVTEKNIRTPKISFADTF